MFLKNIDTNYNLGYACFNYKIILLISKTGFNSIIKGYLYTKGFEDYFKLPTKHSFGWNQINNKIDKQLNFNLGFFFTW